MVTRAVENKFWLMVIILIVTIAIAKDGIELIANTFAEEKKFWRAFIGLLLCIPAIGCIAVCVDKII